MSLPMPDFGEALLNFRRSLAFEWSKDYRAFADKLLTGLSAHLVVELILNLPRSDLIYYRRRFAGVLPFPVTWLLNQFQ